MTLAETVSLDGGAIALILGVLALLVIGYLGLVIGGQVLAHRAGRGETPIQRWLPFPVLLGVLALGRVGDPLQLLLLGGPVVSQVLTYLAARRESQR